MGAGRTRTGRAHDGRLGNSGLAASAKEAFIDGMSLVLVACAVIAVIGALTALFMPDRESRERVDLRSDRRIAA